MVLLGFAVGCSTRVSLVRGDNFQWVLGLDIKGSSQRVGLSVSWCLVDGKVGFDGKITNCLLLVDICNLYLDFAFNKIPPS